VVTREDQQSFSSKHGSIHEEIVMTAAISRTLTAFGVAAVTASVTVGASPTTATAQTPVKASVTGSARIFFAPAPDDNVRFTFDAHTVSPTADQNPRPDAQGMVRVSHWSATQNRTVWVEGEVNCVMTSGRAATLTALVTKTSPEDEKHWMNKHIGFTVFDGGADHPRRSLDQVGFTGPKENLAKCMAESLDAPVMAPAPFAMVQSGGYQVKPAERPPLIRPGQLQP
jgi:hypothetical protein